MKTLIEKMNRLLLTIAMIFIITEACVGQTTDSSSAASTKGQEWKKDSVTINCQEKPYYQVLRYTKAFAQEYNVPEPYLFNLLRTETGLRASDTTYNPFSKRILQTKWDGPYQMLTTTAMSVWQDTLQNLSKSEFRKKMRFDLEFSIHTAIKYIAQLKKKYKDWTVVFSVYNQGPIGAKHINKYARKITKVRI